MDICIGNSRKDKFWKNEEISLEKFIKRISTTIRTSETMEEYIIFQNQSKMTSRTWVDLF